jgi:hypothetical protein
VAASPAQAGPTLAVFASDKGPGDAERSTIMSQAGALLARHKCRIVCIADETFDAIPLITAARAAGGSVLLLVDDGFVLPAGLAGVPIERIDEPEARLDRLGSLAEVIVGLPGSLASTAALYRTWQRRGAPRCPVVLLNHHRAFEAMRGFAADIFSHSIDHADRIVTFTDNVEDLWNKVSWAASQPR